MKKLLLVCCFVFVALYRSAAQDETGDSLAQAMNADRVYTVESVPNAKVATNSYVSDPDNFLQATTVAEINKLLTALEFRTSDQVAVVVVNTIGEEVPKTFAYNLFQYWGIGVKGKDNGLLILMVMDQRRVEFETGYGMESMLPDALCKRIQEAYMVPAFKEGDYDKGILEGVKAVAELLSNPENSKIAAELKAAEDSEEVGTKNFVVLFFGVIYFLSVLIAYFVKRGNKSFKDNFQHKTKNELTALSQRSWLIIYAVIPFLFAVLVYSFFSGGDFILLFFFGNYCMLFFFFIEKRMRLNKALKQTSVEGDYYGNYLKYKESHQYWWVAAIFFPMVFVIYSIQVYFKKRMLRNHPRNCKSCSTAMVKLDEKEDDQHLMKTQLLEEDLKSIDYDVWLCNNCGNKEVNSYVNSFSRYSECSDCGVRAYYLFSNRTIVSATYSSSGTGCKTYKCKSCGCEKETMYTIPMKERSSSSGSSGGGGGGSFGGGSSGGGGSGSSW